MSARRPFVAAALAVGLVVGMLVAVLVFGRISLPAFPTLDAQPEPGLTGMIAFTRATRSTNCVFVIPAAGGEERELGCGDSWDAWPRWTEDGFVAVTDWRAAGRQLVLDPVDGRIVRTEHPDRDGHEVPFSGEHPVAGTLSSRVEDGRVEILVIPPRERERVVAEIRGPRDYGVWELGWSPDGAWGLARDTAGRLLLVRIADGAIRQVADEVSGAAWGAGRASPQSRE
jgi:hypothetical protein